MPPEDEDGGPTGAAAAAAAASPGPPLLLPSLPWDVEALEYAAWRGHRNEVLSLDVWNAQGGQQLLASGSEDATVRVWDVGTGRTTRCFHGVFAGEGVAAVAFCDDSRLFAATSTSLYELDLRSPQGALLVREARATLPALAADDINQLAVQRRQRLLAVADDSGCITLLDTSATPPRPHRTLRRRPPGGGGGRGQRGRRGGGGGASGGVDEASGSDMCTCVAFRPRVQWDLACGFFQQCAVGLWDVGRARCRALDVGAAQQSHQDDNDDDDDDPTISPPPASACQLFNPPYVNSLSFSGDGRFLSVGLGNGEVALYDYAAAAASGDGSEAPAARLRGGHASAVASACFLDEGEGASEQQQRRQQRRRRPYYLASVGNDRVLNLWRCELAPPGGGRRGQQQQQEEEAQAQAQRKPRVIRRVTDLPGKPNWMVSAAGGEGGDGVVRIFVATTEPEISVLTLPRSAASQEEEEEEEKDG